MKACVTGGPDKLFGRAGFQTSHVADAADELGISIVGGSGGFRYCGPSGGCTFGPAFTLQQGEARGTLARHGEVVKELAEEGDVIVIGVEPGLNVATWGLAWSFRAKAKGISAIFIDGPLRDSASLAEAALPVMYRSTSPFRSTGRLSTTSIATSVTIGDAVIRQGDVIFIDADGFVCIPAKHATAICQQAELIAVREELRDEELKRAAGLS